MATRTETDVDVVAGDPAQRRLHRVGVGILEIVPDEVEDRGVRNLKDNLSDRVCALLVAIIAAAQAADIVTTYRALAGHGYVENNPLLRELIARSPVGAFTVKVLMIFAVVLLVLSRLRGQRTRVALVIAAAISLTAPLLNIALMMRS
jgi:uncharacterized membrane protein